MVTRRLITLTLAGSSVAWFAFFGVMYARSRSRMREVGEQLHMTERDFYIAGDPLAPDDHMTGDERLLVVGNGETEYVLASIVRNDRFTDSRGHWKVDYCTGGDPDVMKGRLVVFQSYDKYPTEQDIAIFRRIASTKRFVIWDTPEGSNPTSGEQSVAPQRRKMFTFGSRSTDAAR